MPLATDPDAVWSSLRKPIQHQIKKARKLGVQVHLAQAREDVAHYYRLHLQTRTKKHGMPAQPQISFIGYGMHLLQAARCKFCSPNTKEILLQV